MNLLTNQYADFVGNLHKNPKVSIINDDARSYITQTKGSYDLIQVSLIDTWAATTSGAFMLSENALYTDKAWDTFFTKLSPKGMLSFTLCYIPESH